MVTFTEAATQELRDRIRARLVEGAQAFRGELTEPDPILAGLLADIPEAEHASAARKLDIAAQWMDQAAVSTIHSWCQRMLREHAFDSGSLFTQTLETDQKVKELIPDNPHLHNWLDMARERIQFQGLLLMYQKHHQSLVDH